MLYPKAHLHVEDIISTASSLPEPLVGKPLTIWSANRSNKNNNKTVAPYGRDVLFSFTGGMGEEASLGR